MSMTPFCCAIRLAEIRDFEEYPESIPPIVNGCANRTATVPKKVAWIRCVSWWNLSQIFGNFRRQWDVHWFPSFCLGQKKTVADQPRAFESHGVADAQPAPAHQEHQSPQAHC